jgi:hypothetical protein
MRKSYRPGCMGTRVTSFCSQQEKE